MRTLAGIMWKCMYSRKVPSTSLRDSLVVSQYFLLHIRAAWGWKQKSASVKGFAVVFSFDDVVYRVTETVPMRRQSYYPLEMRL